MSLENVLKEMSGKEYSFLKSKLTEILTSEIIPVGKQIKKLMEDRPHLENVLKKAGKKPILELRKTSKLYVKKWD